MWLSDLQKGISQRRDERADSGEQIERLEYEGDGAGTPGLLQEYRSLPVAVYLRRSCAMGERHT